ncbi:dTMP kinase [Ruminiclostridium cellulolyticum]|uniref:Thymidylate kinase n=1 Tax=Ruminiclostridium cellulolyticum (strain ATCC 35319 / DSM 5812 / JCM 6584 / H10) TaxID=394503 RepID=B8I676_RUMCH|nr:deoxynucleoside kinase [Ruminiclostridium cellulolyticum]ACL76841.1 Thymidylate kinase-like protein [Ruminiclostridium cellulolyticum H10]
MQQVKSTSSVKGMLIVFEGISGCGKSESVEALRKYLSDKGYKTSVLEWNSNKIIRKITKAIDSIKLLTPGVYSFLQWIGFLIDYFFKVVPLLKKNYILIADRYIYTGLIRDSVNGAGRIIGSFLHRIVKKPAMVFFLDVSPEVCDERIKKRGKALFHTNRLIWENKLLKNKELYYLNKLRREYLLLFNSKTLLNETNIISVNEDTETVVKCVNDYISGRREIYEYFKPFN